MIKTMADNNVNISASTDAALYHTLSLSKHSYFIKDFGDAFRYATSGLDVSVGSGMAVIYGRHILNDGAEPLAVTVPPNSKGYIVLKFDKSNANGNETLLTYSSTLSKHDIMNQGTRYDLEICEYTSSSNNVQITKDCRVYFDDDESFMRKIGLYIYPIGSIYLSINSANPSSIFGGKWEAFASGRTLVGVDTHQSQFNTVMKVGGHKEMPAHSHKFSGNTSEGGEHTHNIPLATSGAGNSNYAMMGYQNETYRGEVGKSGKHKHTISGTTAVTGAGNAGNLPPYITTYIWRRIA